MLAFIRKNFGVIERTYATTASYPTPPAKQQVSVVWFERYTDKMPCTVVRYAERGFLNEENRQPAGDIILRIPLANPVVMR